MERLEKFNNKDFKNYYLESVTSKYFDEKEIKFIQKNIDKIILQFNIDYKILNELTGISKNALMLLYENELMKDIFLICDKYKLSSFLFKEFKEYCKVNNIKYSEL
mgnify:CR=1 FL=1